MFKYNVVNFNYLGTVRAVGSEVKNLKVGDRVAVEPGYPCHACDQVRVLTVL